MGCSDGVSVRPLPINFIEKNFTIAIILQYFLSLQDTVHHATYSLIQYIVIHYYYLVPGYKCASSEVIIQAERVGPFSTTLHCHLEQSSEPLTMLQVQGHVQVSVCTHATAISIVTTSHNIMHPYCEHDVQSFIQIIVYTIVYCMSIIHRMH